MEDITEASLHTLKDCSLMMLKFKVYTYITPEHKPGTLIVHPDLTYPFDERKLFEMDELHVQEISLREILEKGFIKFGSTDLMDELDIQYPLIRNDTYEKNKIVGRHWDYELSEVAEMIGKEFELEKTSLSNENSESDSESNSDSDLNEISDLVDRRFVSIDYNEDSDEGAVIEPSNSSLDGLDGLDGPSEPKILESALQDGKMDEIFDKIAEGERTLLAEADNLLAELEF